MKYGVAFVVFLSLAVSILWAQHGPISASHYRNLTPDRALEMARSEKSKPHLLFRIVRQIDSNSDTRQVAAAAREAAQKHVKPYDGGIFLDILNEGGFLILEVDPDTDHAVSVHVVSIGSDGKPIIRSHRIEGDVSEARAQTVVLETSEFVETLLVTRPSDISKLESKFYNGRFPEFTSSENQSLLAIPHAFIAVAADQDKVRELAALLGAFQLWPIRYAISLQIYSADPLSALKLALEKQDALVKEIMRMNARSPDYLHDLQDIDSVHTTEQLQERLNWFRRLDDFLEKQIPPKDTPTFCVNRLISTVALEIGESDNAYFAMTAPGLIVGWKPVKSDALAITVVSLAPD